MNNLKNRCMSVIFITILFDAILEFKGKRYIFQKGYNATKNMQEK